ncbi:MAG TPA: hypothetical protein VFP95_04825, partial [Gammaproteobacteria bacterium]|nr:hypothetical protein [Gammaproteobacteria bacterium]
MEMDPINGGGLSYTVFDINGDGVFDADDFSQFDVDGDGTLDNVPVSGVQSTVGIVNTPGIISAGDTEYKYLSGSSGEIERVAEKSEDDPARTSWRELLIR